MKYALMTLLIVVTIALIALGAAVVWCFRFAHRRMDHTKELADNEVRLAYRDMVNDGLAYIEAHPHENVSVTSFDGLRLHGLYLPIDSPRAAILCFHGYRSTGTRDFAPMPEFYQSLGLSVLIVDQRACGKSEGKYTTFGILERQDVLTWARYMDDRLGGTPILLDGLSLGAATVMLAADLPLPKSVRGIIADCGFTSPWDIIAHCGKKWFRIPAFPMVYILSGISRMMFGAGYRACSTQQSLANSSLPLLLLHGGDDDFVPTYMSEQHFSAAAGYKRKVIVPGAGHGMSYLTDMPRCQKELVDFIEHTL